MSHELIQVGATANDGLGDSLRVAVSKINQNFITLYSAFPDIQPQIVYTGSSNSDGDTLPIAFDKINANFKQLNELTNQPEVEFNVRDSLRKTFENVNLAFTSLFEILATQLKTTEIVDPLVQRADSIDSNYNINITNNYNFYVSNEQSNQQLKLGPYGSQEYINVGTTANDGTGDPLRVAFQKVNDNFSNLFYTSTVTTTSYSSGTAPSQVIYEVPVSSFTQGTFQIRSSTANSSQCITLSAQIANANSTVKFTGYGTTFDGSYLTKYNMDVDNANVRILVDPLVNANVQHFVSAQVTYSGAMALQDTLQLNTSISENI